MLKKEDVKVFNMGVDYDKYDNEYWRKLEKDYKDNLVIIPFSSNKKDKDYYWDNIGVNCITGIYVHLDILYVKRLTDEYQLLYQILMVLKKTIEIS